MPSRKNGRFSGKNSAKRLLAAIWATSASTWEKSGLIVASSAVLAVGLHFTSRPTFLSVGSSTSGSPTSAARATSWALAYGATTRWLEVGRPGRPVSSRERQITQLELRGTGLL